MTEEAREVRLEQYREATGMLQDNKKLKDKERLLLEEQRLAFMQSVYSELPGIETNEAEEPSATKKAKWKKTKLGLLLFGTTFGAAEAAVWTYYGSMEMLTGMIPGLSLLILIPVCAVLTAICVMQFVGFEVSQMKEMLGIEATRNAEKLLLILENQIKYTRKLNKALTNVMVVDQLTDVQYRQYVEVVKELNKDVLAKKAFLEKYNESKRSRYSRYAMNAAGLLLALIETFFGTKLLLASIAAGLAATPVGFIIIGLAMLSTVILYYSMRGSGLEALFHPGFLKFKTVLGKFNKFAAYEAKVGNSFDYVLRKKEGVAVENPIADSKPITPKKRSNLSPAFFQPVSTVTPANDTSGVSLTLNAALS